MSRIKNALDEILNCPICFGLGYQGWADDSSFEFDFCECNPYNLIIEEEKVIA